MLKYTLKIVNDKIEDLIINLGLNVTINGVSIAITPKIDMTGMKLSQFVDIFWAGFKVKFQSTLRTLSPEQVKATFDGKSVSWVECLSKAAAKESASYADMTPAQLEAKIAELEALRAAQATARLAEAENVSV